METCWSRGFRVNETLRRKFTCVAAYFFVRQDSRTSVADYASLRLCRPTASIRLCTACPPNRMSISLRFSSFQLIVHAELCLAYPYHQRRLTLHTCQPGWVKVAYPHHQIPINAAEGRKHTSDPRPCTTSDDEGMKPTSDSHPTKRGSDEGRKCTSNLNPSNDIACRLRAKTNSWQATWQPACLPETIFVYARNYSTKTAFKYHQHPRHHRKPQCFRSLQFYTKLPRPCSAVSQPNIYREHPAASAADIRIVY